LGSGGVEDERVDYPEPVVHRRDQLVHLRSIGDVCRQCVGRASVVPDRPHHLACFLVTVQAVHGDGKAVAGEPSRDRAAETT
jgi:hypothetical protein